MKEDSQSIVLVFGPKGRLFVESTDSKNGVTTALRKR
jgi:hypothetical protein